MPAAFGARRLAARVRLRRMAEDGVDDGAAVDADARATPQNVEESVAFFADGGRLLWRDVRRGRALARADDSAAAYAWFAMLSFSTFPLTPLLLPLIDARRHGARDARRDYVPSR